MADVTEPTQTVAIAVDQSEYSRHALEFYLEKIHSSKFELVLITILDPIYAINFVPASGYAMGAIYVELIHSSKFKAVIIFILEPNYGLNCVPASGYTMGAIYCNAVHQPGSKVLVVHTVEPLYLTSMVAAAGFSQGEALAALPSSHWQQMAAEQKEKVRKLKERYDHIFEEKSIPRHWRVIETTASPGEAIIATAEEVGASMIVVGSRGQGVLRRTILGSVSDYVLHHAKVPVLVSHGAQ